MYLSRGTEKKPPTKAVLISILMNLLRITAILRVTSLGSVYLTQWNRTNNVMGLNIVFGIAIMRSNPINKCPGSGQIIPPMSFSYQFACSFFQNHVQIYITGSNLHLLFFTVPCTTCSDLIDVLSGIRSISLFLLIIIKI